MRSGGLFQVTSDFSESPMLMCYYLCSDAIVKAQGA